jgi:hypothetical protein
MGTNSVHFEGALVYTAGSWSREVDSWIENNLQFYTVGAFGFSVFTLETPGLFICQNDFHMLFNVRYFYFF